ncbi:MAG TPA: T9SS type A sorting domain-containing protein, partial [Mucilaginibacter sp.]
AFTGTTTLIIPAGLTNYPSLTANESIYGLTIASGASLNLNGYTLTVGCNIYNSGTGNILYNSNNASGITWAGSIAQSYTGSANSKTQAANMTVNNTAGLNLTIAGGNIDVYKLLTITKGNVVVDNANSGLLTLKSSASQSANVDVIPSSYSITGLVNVERFLTGGGLSTNRGYRILSSPVNQTSAVSSTSNTFGLSYLKDHTYYGNLYAGAFTGGPAGTSAGFSATSIGPTIYLWDERKADNNQGYTTGKNIGVTKITTSGLTSAATTSTVDLSNAQTGLSIPVGNGFELFFVGPSSRTTGSSSIPPADATMVANGYLNQQNVTVKLWYTPTGGSSGNLSYTSSLGTTAAGYNMVGNPYASTINLQTVLTDNAAAIDNIYLLSAKNAPSQTFIAYTANGTSSPSAGYAVSGEGFLVHAKATGQSLVFKESEKSAATQLTGAALIMSAPKGQQIIADKPGKNNQGFGNFTSPASAFAEGQQQLTGLYLKMEKDSLSFNYCGIYFGDGWSAKFQEGDAQDLNSTGNATVMSSFSSDGIRSAVKHFPDYKTAPRRIKLYVNGKTDGLYTLKIEGIRNIDTGNYKITLLDHYTKDSLDIGRYGAYAFNIIKKDTASFGGSRFELVIGQPAKAKYKLANFTAQKAVDGVLLTWRAYNEGNNYFFSIEKQLANNTGYSQLYQVQSNGGSIYKFTDKAPNTGNNTYRLKQVDLFGNITYSAPVTVFYDENGNSDMFSVYPNPAAETLNISVTNSSTNNKAVQYTLQVHDIAGNLVLQKTSANPKWKENISQFNPGVYIVRLTDSNGQSLGQVKVIKK